MLKAFITAAHLAALSQIETGDNDRAVGKAGELSRYQFLPEEAAKAIREDNALRGRTFTVNWQRDPAMARAVTLCIWQNRVATFRTIYQRDPSLTELYMVWHRPARPIAPKPKELARARLFANLALDFEQQGTNLVGQTSPSASPVPSRGSAPVRRAPSKPRK